MTRLKSLVLFTLMCGFASGCAVSPTYVDDAKLAEQQVEDTSFNPVHFKLEPSFQQAPPSCIAVLPITNGMSEETSIQQNLIALTDESLEQLRWSLYSQVAPYAYRDIELVNVNKAIELVGSSTDYPAIGKALKCDALLLAEVTEYDSGFFGIYSQTSIGVKMKLIRAENSELLWQGSHVAQNHGGSVPLSPISLIVGIYSASENLSDEQLIRVRDDVFRRLLSTWVAPEAMPDNALATTQLANNEQEEESYPFNIVVKNLYLRSGPGTKYKAKTVLDQQDKITIVDDKFSPWVQVKIEKGATGYVKKKYLSLTKHPNTMASLRLN